MAEEKKTAPDGQKPAEGEAPKKSKKMLFVGGGAAAVLALAFIASLMAVPKPHEEPELEGPFVAKLSKEQIQANLAGADGKRYLVLSLQAEYFAYEEHYVTGRLGGGAAGGHGGAPTEDPLYLAMLKDALLTLAATKTINQVTDPVLIDSFLEEVREAVDPVLFPVYVGDSLAPGTADKVSGLRVGESVAKSTMRGLLHEHAVEIDAARKTIALDDGPPMALEKSRDLQVVDRRGEFVYLDTTKLVEGFSGEVPVGAPGRVKRIFKDSFLVQ
ncbi:MAG: hypothetical protein K8S98_05945 [Planctomycetes bacterium]|nr:hypothetical protein [Planctomycetota bacterium]